MPETTAKETETSASTLALQDEPVASSELPSANDQEEKDGIVDGRKKNRHRKRKKALHSAIRAQMEFYFSDANLSKDRYMQNAIKDSPGKKIQLCIITKLLNCLLLQISF